jgi:hypothetical protein
LLLVPELDHVAGLKKALQCYRGERVIFHGPSEFLARTGKKLGHGTQVGVKANRLRVNQLLDRAARINSIFQFRFFSAAQYLFQ